MKFQCLENQRHRGLPSLSSFTSPRKQFVRVTHLLPQPQDLEALKVVERPALGDPVLVLGPRALGELLLDLGGLPGLADDTVAGSTGELGDDDRGEGQVGKSDGVARDGLVLGGGGTVDEDLLMVSPRFLLLVLPRWVPTPRCGWGFSTYALVVDDLNDRGKLALVLAGCEEHNTADLDESPLRCLDLCVTHCD